MSKTTRCLKVLEKCKNMKHLKQSHAQVITTGLQNNTFALSRLLSFCSNPNYQALNHGFKLFNLIENPTICIYNTMIKACLLNGKWKTTIEVYIKLLEQGMSPDHYTFPYLLKACANLGFCYLGELIHGHCLKLGFICDVYVGNTLIVMYSSFCDMKSAHNLFDEIPLRTEVSWTVMISGFAKKGDVESSRLFFDSSPKKDLGIWGSMISSYVQNSCFKEGLYMFRVMQSRGVKPDEAIFVSVLCACAQLGAIDTGIWIHKYLERLRLPLSARLGTGLIDMYSKCGNLELAKIIFEKIPKRDTICFNVMIYAMAMHGDGEGAVNLFSEMEKMRVPPDDVTFIAVFTACSYANLAGHGLRLLHRMCTMYRIEPKSEHYGCIVDFLSRTGLLKEAKKIIDEMPVFSSGSNEAFAWRALLSACCNYEEIHLAEGVAKKLLMLENHSGVYVLLSNLYSGLGRHEDARKMRKMMRNRGVEKMPGCSSVEINGIAHEFIAGEKTHPSIQDVNEILTKIRKHFDC